MNVRGLFRVESHSPLGSRRVHGRRMPMGWMWPLHSGPRMRAANQRRSSDYTLRRSHHDSCGFVRLSKIAHIRRMGDTRTSGEEVVHAAGRCGACASGRSNSLPQSKHTRYDLPLIVKIRLRWWCRHPKTNWKIRSNRFIGAYSRRRSQLPLASSHSRRARTLALASAMEQSAAP